ncbi:MAG: hypothetical protein Q8O59_04340 [bacterium]|nr:hypothetical protein [bacterium]
MKQVIIFIFVFLGVSVLYLVSLPLQKVFVLPLTGLTHTVNGIVLVLIGLKLKKDLLGSTSADLAKKYFMYFFFSVGMFQLVMGLPHVVLYFNQAAFAPVITWAYIIGHMFLYLSLAFTVMVPLELAFPGKKIKNIYFSLIALFGLFITYINIIKPNNPIYESKTGITLLNADPLVGKLIPVIVLLSWGVSALIFLYNGIKSRHNRLAIVRSSVISLGFILLIVGGPMHDLARTSLQFLMADILTIFGFLVLASGTLLKLRISETVVEQV